MRTKLSVNINKFATLRNARGGNNPDVIRAALDCEAWGADGITVHPRPDERHIRRSDVYELKEKIKTELNIEGYPDRVFMDLLTEVRPAQVTLVPDPPHVLTSNAGWDTKKELHFLQEIISELKSSGMRVSIFLDPDPGMIECAKLSGADRIELYTESYASQYMQHREKAIADYVSTALAAAEAGLEINAGHDLDLKNLHYFVKTIPSIKEVSIGHALVCDALYLGLQNAVQMYKARLDPDFEK